MAVFASKKDIAVFHDARCIDGALSAAQIVKAVGRSVDVRLVPISFGNPEARTKLFNEHITRNSHVIFVDTSPTVDELPHVISLCNSLRVWDHHYSTLEAMGAFASSGDAQGKEVQFIVDEKCPSATELTNRILGGPITAIAGFVGKMEPQGNLKHSRKCNEFAIAAAIDAMPIGTKDDIEDTYAALERQDMRVLEAKGVQQDNTHCQKISKAFEEIYFVEPPTSGPLRKPMPVIKANVRDLGRRIDQELRYLAATGQAPQAAGAWFEVSGEAFLSIRTIGEMNAAEIAKAYGNGGGQSGASRAVFNSEAFHGLLRVRPETSALRLSAALQRCQPQYPITCPAPELTAAA